MNIHKLISLTVVSAFFGFARFSAQAALSGPVYPAPGGNSFFATGAASAGDSGGRNFNYSGFDSSAFSSLYWGPTGPGAIASGLSGDNHTMTFAGIFGSQGETARWTGTTTYFNGTAYVTVGTEFDATVSGLGANPWVLGGTLGLPVGAVVNDSAGQNFSVNLQFLANGVALNTVSHEGSSFSSFGAGFYYTAPVPEPTTVVAGALLLLPFGLSTIKKLKKRSAQS